MENPVGLIATAVNAFLFLFISLYMLFSRRDKDTSHYLFYLLTLSLFIYSALEGAKFAGDENIALWTARISPSIIALAAYFFILFTYYLKIGWSKELAVISFLPIVFVVIFSYLYLIDGVKYTPFGYVAIFNFKVLVFYSLSLTTYFAIGLLNLSIIYKNVSIDLKRKILYFIIGGVAVIAFSALFILQIMENEYILPFLNLSLVFLGFLYFYALLK